jgi:hypothetical protein
MAVRVRDNYPSAVQLLSTPRVTIFPGALRGLSVNRCASSAILWVHHGDAAGCLDL